MIAGFSSAVTCVITSSTSLRHWTQIIQLPLLQFAKLRRVLARPKLVTLYAPIFARVRIENGEAKRTGKNEFPPAHIALQGQLPCYCQEFSRTLPVNRPLDKENLVVCTPPR